MKYVITGGCGFLGANIAARIIQTGEDLTILDNLSRYRSSENLKWLETLGRFQFVHGDVRNCSDIETLIADSKPAAVFHLAGQVAMTTSLTRPRLDFEVNALGTLNVLEALRRHQPACALIYSSTNKVYGDLEQLEIVEKGNRYELPGYPLGVPETIGLEFHSPYGCSKGAADQYVLDYARMFGMNTIVFRHSSMYGGRQFATYDQGWVGWFCQQAIEQAVGSTGEFTITGNGKQVRDVLHVDDAVDLYMAAASAADRMEGQAFNIGGGMGNSLSILELIEKLEEMVKHKLAYRYIAPRGSDQKVFVADIRKIRDAIGWTPRIDLEEGLRSMLDWVARLRPRGN